MRKSGNPEKKTARQGCEVRTSVGVQQYYPYRRTTLNLPVRIWFAPVHNLEELEEALQFARGLLEETILAHKVAQIEIFVERKFCEGTKPIPQAAGQIS